MLTDQFQSGFVIGLGVTVGLILLGVLVCWLVSFLEDKTVRADCGQGYQTRTDPFSFFGWFRKQLKERWLEVRRANGLGGELLLDALIKIFAVFALPLFVISFPYLGLLQLGVAIQTVSGMAAAGAVLALVAVPFTVWYFLRLGIIRAVRITLITVPGGAWFSTLMVLFIAAMTLD